MDKNLVYDLRDVDFFPSKVETDIARSEIQPKSNLSFVLNPTTSKKCPVRPLIVFDFHETYIFGERTLRAF